MQLSPDAIITGVAAEQHGIISRTQLYEAGLSRQQIATRTRNGSLRRIDTAVFAVRGATNTYRSRVQAAVLSQADARASFESAAHLHRIDVRFARKVVITVPETGAHRGIADQIHRSNYMPWRHRIEIDGIATTSLERTLFDLAGLRPRWRTTEALDWALTTGKVQIERLLSELDALAASGRPGIVLMRQLLEARIGAAIVNASILEARTMLLIREADVPEPDREWRPPWGGSLVGRVDFAFPESRTILEADGRKWHSRDLDFDNDRRRDQVAAANGWLVIRAPWSQIDQSPSVLISTLEATIKGRTFGFPD